MSPDPPSTIRPGGSGMPVSPPADTRDLLAAVIVESQKLRADVHTAEEARRRANIINLAVLAGLAVLVVSLLVIGWQNHKLLEQTRETNQRVADCTTPGGVCFEESRQRTADAVSALTRISIYVSQCGRLYPGESGPEFDVKVERCVAERLARAAATPSPTQGRPPTASPSG